MLRNYLRRAYRTLLPIIYSKKNYKFFLATNFKDMDAKTKRFFLASNALNAVFKPVLVTPPFGKRALVIAPHQDDEAIGCGGAVLKHIEAGGDVRIVLVQDGGGAENTIGITRQKLIEMRERESRASARLMGCDEPSFLRFPSVSAETVKDVADRLTAILAEYSPTAIFSPWVLDNHQEHMFTAKALAMALSRQPVRAQVYSYEVWGLCIPNTAVALDSVIERKTACINCFTSQTTNNDYAHAFKGLAMYHSLQFGAIDTKYVERFFALPAEEFVSFVDRVAQG